MYSPDDAVAKVDGYVISVHGGTPYVGEKRLVRIEEAGRTSAVASLVDANGSPHGSHAGSSAGRDSSPAASSSGDEALESKPRRRGRRGGRRRSGTKASSASASSE
jgi:ribonuclease G